MWIEKYIEVEVELDDFETQDLYDELVSRLSTKEINGFKIDCTFDGIDVNAYAYWLCYIDLDGNLNDLLENIQLYGGIK
jgi:hypothetical protein